MFLIMKRILYICFMLCCLSVNAQETTTLYRYGKPLETCETNFENLFANFHKYVKGEGVDLLSYEYVGTVKNAKHAQKLVKKNVAHSPLWIISKGEGIMKGGSETVERYSELKIESMAKETVCKEEKEEMIKTVANEFVHPGDNIYLLRFVYNMETFEQYVFIHPDTKEVVTKGDVFGFDIKMSHIEYCNEMAAKK